MEPEYTEPVGSTSAAATAGAGATTVVVVNAAGLGIGTAVGTAVGGGFGLAPLFDVPHACSAATAAAQDAATKYCLIFT